MPGTDLNTNYKQLNQELDRLIEVLQGGELDVDEAIASYEKATKLIKQMEDYLSKSELKINQLKLDIKQSEDKSDKNRP